VQRTFADFDDYWATVLLGPSVGPSLAAMASEETAILKARMRARLPADATGRITYSARANAVKGLVPPRSAPARSGTGARALPQAPRRPLY
jgi:hypothetical protein